MGAQMTPAEFQQSVAMATAEHMQRMHKLQLEEQNYQTERAKVELEISKKMRERVFAQADLELPKATKFSS